jgi:hypothetical protein
MIHTVLRVLLSLYREYSNHTNNTNVVQSQPQPERQQKLLYEDNDVDYTDDDNDTYVVLSLQNDADDPSVDTIVTQKIIHENH